MNLVRRVATVAALSLAAAGLVGVAAQPATAAGSSFAWQISQQFHEHLYDHTLAGGATEAGAGVVTFPGGEGSFDPATGAGTVQYDGSVVGAFTGYYSVTIAEPAVTVDEDGNGEITALVSSWEATGHTDPVRVVVTTFDADGGWGSGTITATPDWAGVLPSGTESAALGIPAGQPVDGQAFAPEFIGQLTSGVRAHFYASNRISDPAKPPASFTATGEETGPTIAAKSSYEGRAVTIAVDGTSFTAVTQPGDDGVYVALAPAGDFPETDDFEDQEKVADAEWVPAAAMLDGSFSVTLNPESQYLDPSQQYAVYTWQAHAHSNPSQDTETAVEIKWSSLAGPTALTAKVAKAPTTRKAGKLTAAVTGADTAASGKVTVNLTRKGQKAKHVGAKVVNGKATVKLPKLAKGAWKAKVTFLPTTAAYKSATRTLSVKVK